MLALYEWKIFLTFSTTKENRTAIAFNVNVPGTFNFVLIDAPLFRATIA